MSKKLTILSAARRLPGFTVSELGDKLGVPSSTVQTVLNRVPDSWFTKSQRQSGARGGQPKVYEASDEGRQAIDSLLAAFSDPPAPATDRAQPDAPLGLLAAEEIRRTLQTADLRAIAGLRVDAAANLDWAEDELRDGLFAAQATAVKQRISKARAALREFAPREDAVPAASMTHGSRKESIFAIARDRIAQWSHFLNEPALAPAMRHQVFIGCVGSSAGVQNLAVVARAALNGAAQVARARPVDLVIQNVGIEEIDTTFMESWPDAAVDHQSLVWCIDSATDDGSIRKMLEHRQTVHTCQPAVVLDLAFSPRVETIAQAADVLYTPHAGDGTSMAWVNNLSVFE
jgi:predicted ArsR family transcriptional regulator